MDNSNIDKISGTNIKNSDLLNHIINSAKAMENSGEAKFTTARLLLCALELFWPRENVDKEKYDRDEIQNTAEILKSHFGDPESLSACLKSLISSESENKVQDLSLQMNLYSARQEAAKQGKKILSADAIISYLLNHPNNTIQNIYAQMEKASEQAKSSFRFSLLNEKARELRQKLSETVHGQDHAIQTLVEAYFHAKSSEMPWEERKRPKAFFLFAGPPGVGKTLLAKRAAELLGLDFACFDMSDYATGETALTLFSKSPASVSSFLERIHENGKRECIILFDEIEKANPFSIQQFLQILDGGRVLDQSRGQEFSFDDAILIFTTNAGRSLYESSDTGNFSDVPQKTILKSLGEDINPFTGHPYFPPELCSRFATGNVVMFNYLEARFLIEIAREEISNRKDIYQKKYGVSLEIDESVYAAILFSEGGAADARTIRSRAEEFLQKEIYELVRLADGQNGDPDSDRIKKIHIRAQLPGEKAPETRKLFISEEQQDLLVFASSDITEKIHDACSQDDSTYKVNGAQKEKDARKLLSEKNIRLILIDLTCGRRAAQTNYLNIEDVDSEARNLLAYVREYYRDIPVYLLESKNYSLSEEETVSFLQVGVSGMIDPESEDLSLALQKLGEQLHQQDSMRSLARSNRLVTYETGQTLSKDGSKADISLFDFALKTAVDPTEAGNIMSDVSKPNIHFDQVIGATLAKQSLQELVDQLKNPRKFAGFGISAPRGMLLYGPPGTGKTMLAKALACESDASFIEIEGNRFLDKYIGEGPRRVHEYFQLARKYAPSILFVDEVDAIAMDRNSEEATYTKDILTAFLTEMDGFRVDPSRPVFILAATNAELNAGEKGLDRAFLRRFDERIYVGLPDKESRKMFLDVKAGGNPSFKVKKSTLENIAARSVNMSLADLEQVMNQSIRLAIREGKDKVTDALLDEAFERQKYGEARRNRNDDEVLRTARHEAGHAYLDWISGSVPEYITIVSRGNFGGYVLPGGSEEPMCFTKNELLSRIRTSLAGRAAEIVYYGSEEGISNGPSSDLQKATWEAEQILCSYGMDSSFGLAVMSCGLTQNLEMDPEVRNAVNELLEDQMEKTIEIIQKGKEQIDLIVEELIARNQITGDEMVQLICKKAHK